MATRTLEHFRAEHNVWRKDLAEELGISEEALERLELTGEVPADIAQKLAENYSLPEDYFTADVDMVRAERAASLRSDPKKPLLYFAGVSFVWLLIISAIQYAVRLPLRIANTLDYASVPVFSYIEDLSKLPLASHVVPLYSEKEGYVSKLDCLKLGISAMKLGAGRETMDDKIDMSAGIVLNKKLGDKVNKGELLCYIHTNKDSYEEVVKDVISSFHIQKEPVKIHPIVHEYIK